MDGYWLAARVVAAIHLGIVAVMLLGWVAIMAGRTRDWGFVRNAWLRAAHLAAFAVIAGYAAAGKLCPLTTLEFHLLKLGGRDAGGEDPLLVRLIDATLYPDVAPAILSGLAVFFGVTTIFALWLVPPRRRKGEKGTAFPKGG